MAGLDWKKNLDTSQLSYPTLSKPTPDVCDLIPQCYLISFSREPRTTCRTGGQARCKLRWVGGRFRDAAGHISVSITSMGYASTLGRLLKVHPQNFQTTGT